MRGIGEAREDSERTQKAGYQGEATNRAVSRGPAQGWRTRGRPRVVRGVVRASYDVTRSVTLPPLPPTINDATLHPLSRAPSSLSPPSPPPWAEPTGPSTQRGGGCFCNLATLPIFSIHTTSYSRYFVSRLSLRSIIHHPFCILDNRGLSLHPFLSLSIPRLLSFLLFDDINNAIAQASRIFVAIDGSNNVWSALSTKELSKHCAFVIACCQ